MTLILVTIGEWISCYKEHISVLVKVGIDRFRYLSFYTVRTTIILQEEFWSKCPGQQRKTGN